MKGRRTGSAILQLARSAASVFRPRITSDAGRARICRDLLYGRILAGDAAEFASALSKIPIDERHYWIGTFYTLLLDPSVRRRQATFFTPPSLAETVIDLALEAGFDVRTGDVLDPAAGGAAFLSTLAARAKADELDPVAVSYRLNGIELDQGLAALSRSLIADRLGVKTPRGMIISGDALRTKVPASYDLVIANPPYGRMSDNEVAGLPWKDVCHRGHINKYALFVELCLRHAKPGGIVALVIPSSFRAGPLFAKLREHIRSEGQVLAIGTVAQRNQLFVDVAQDVSVLIVRKGEPHQPELPVTFHSIGAPTPSREQAILPIASHDPWPLPSSVDEFRGGCILADWAVEARSGYFVWNRQLDRLTASPDKGSAFPLVWAKNAQPGQPCRPSGKNGRTMDFVTFENPSRAIIKGPAIILQRTTNEKQERRILASVVDPQVVEQYGGFTTENHTIALTAPTQVRADLLCRLLNTEEVDRRYRKVSGTAAISVALLRKLDLPSPEAFSDALSGCFGDAEAAARYAYASSMTTVS